MKNILNMLIEDSIIKISALKNEGYRRITR